MNQLLRRRVNKKRLRPINPHQPLPQTQRPDEGIAGGQEPAEDRRSHRVWQKRVAAAGNRMAERPDVYPHQLLQEPACQVLHEREHVHRHQPEPVRVQPGEQQRNGHPHPARRRRPAL